MEVISWIFGLLSELFLALSNVYIYPGLSWLSFLFGMVVISMIVEFVISYYFNAAGGGKHDRN